MKNLRSGFDSLCILMFAGFVLSMHGQPERLAGSGLVVLEGGAVFVSADATLRPDSVMVIQGERILRLGRVGDFEYAPDAKIVDVRGRYIFPGFIDLHAHVKARARVEIVRTLLAYGITTARSPGVYDSSVGVELRELIAKGELPGPRLVAGGPFINGPRNRIPGMVLVRSAEDMRSEIRRQKQLGVDWIKLYWDVTPALVEVAVQEAHAVDLRVAGHMRTTSWTEAAELGIDTLEHSGADGPTWELAPDESERNALRGNDPPSTAAATIPPADYYNRLSASIDISGAQMDRLASALKRSRVTVVPTLVIIQSLYFGDDLEVLKRLEPERMDPSIVATFGAEWQRANPFVFRIPTGRAQNLTTGKVLWPKTMRVVRALYDRGVNIATGSDLGMPWVTPGVSLHREMELLVEAGIPIRDVLLSATRKGAEALGLLRESGTIEVGKVADLVVLRRNPLEDIRHTRSIEAVYRAGQYHDPARLTGVR